MSGSESRVIRMDDLSVSELARYLSFLDQGETGKKYKSQKAHMLLWLEAQQETHGGAYGRIKANDSAKAMYNRFQNPDGLLWIAKALGEDEETLRSASESASKADKKSRCKAFRAVIPWERVIELLENPLQWHVDARLADVVTRNEKTGYPQIAKGMKAKYESIIASEIGL